MTAERLLINGDIRRMDAACLDPAIPDDTMAMIGAARGPLTYPFGSLIDTGAPYCITSDWAVTTLNPFAIIGTAVTREPPHARGRAAPLYPEQRMTVAEAVLGYTSRAAVAWRGHVTGQLSPGYSPGYSAGYSADLIVPNRDIFPCDPYDIAETTVPGRSSGAKPSTSPDL